MRADANWCSIAVSERAARPIARGNDRFMPDDFDHEVIDSPEALLRHLHEAHGVEEARELDPTGAPIQFWLRKHAELERAARRDPAGSAPEPRADARPAEPRPPAGQPRPAPAAAAGPRYRPFADPLVEAVAAALVRRGLEERQVRRWIASYSSPDGRRGGEEAVRASFLAPVLDALAAQLGGAGGRPSPPPAARAPEASAPAAQGAQPAPRGPAPPAPALDADFMAIADVLQSRKRRSGGGLREPPASPREAVDERDDYMALADAVQQRRARR